MTDIPPDMREAQAAFRRSSPTKCWAWVGGNGLCTATKPCPTHGMGKDEPIPKEVAAAGAYAAITQDRDRYKALYEESAEQAIDLSTRAVTAEQKIAEAESRMGSLERRNRTLTQERDAARALARELTEGPPRARTIDDDLEDCLAGLDRIQDGIFLRWQQSQEMLPESSRAEPDAIWQWQWQDGRPMLADVTVARANVLLAIEARAREVEE